MTNAFEELIDPSYKRKNYGVHNTCIFKYKITQVEGQENDLKYQILIRDDSSHLDELENK